MSDRQEFDLDRALAALGDTVRRESPSPGEALMARVLADAAEARPPEPLPVATAAPDRPSLFTWVFGWSGSAATAMALSLVIGIGLGMEIGSGLDTATTQPDTGLFGLDGEELALLGTDE